VLGVKRVNGKARVGVGMIGVDEGVIGVNTGVWRVGIGVEDDEGLGVNVSKGVGKAWVTVEVVKEDALKEEVGNRIPELDLHDERKASETVMTMVRNRKA
jgi:hypothetical protein